MQRDLPLPRTAGRSASGVMLAIAWAALFALTFAEWRAMAHQWWDIDTYSHILLVPPIIAWLAWIRRDELARAGAAGWWPGLGWLVFGLVVGIVVRRTALGLLIEALGVNRRASMLAGVSTGVLLIAAYVLSGLCATIAGTIAAADIRGADANNAGLWLELDAILAVVVGGTSLLGGRFSIAGSLIGAMIIQSINTGILLSGFPPEFNLIIKAGIIVLILVIQSPRAALAFGWFARPRTIEKREEGKA